MKNIKLLIKINVVLILCTTFLFGIYKTFNTEEKVEKNELVAMLNINENVFKELNKEELFKVLDKEKAAIYIGPYTKEYTQILKTFYNASKKNKISKLYYINIEEEKSILSYNNEVIVEKEATPFFDKLLDRLGSFTEIYTLYNQYNEPINSGYKTIYTPMVIFIKEGKILFTHYVKDINLTEEELNNLKEIYKLGFKKIS